MPSRAWPSFGRHTRNHLSTVATVNTEILVGRQDDGVGKRFGHTNEASIGEAHGNIGVFLDQLRNRLYVLGKLEGDDQRTAAKQLTETRHAALSEKVVRLRQSCFACRPRRTQIVGLSHRPLVVSVAVAKQRHHKTRVSENVPGHSPWLANTPSCAQLGRTVIRQPIRRDRRWH